MLMKSVKIKNFRGYGENSQSEDGFYCFNQLDKSFVLISGFNGYGKTSFYEAIEWCLSDSVKRLEKFKEVYNITDLKKGKYLKFQKSNGESTTNREIVVELQFIEKISQKVTTITRKTNSDMLGVGDYKSYLFIQQDEEQMREVSLNEIEKVLFWNNNSTLQEKNNPDISNFLFSNIMTQDNLHDFLCTNDLKERQKLFLKLMSKGNSQKISERLNRLTPNSFTNKLKDLNSTIDLKIALLNRVSEKVQAENTQFYFDKLNTEVENFHAHLLKFVNIKPLLPITIENYKAFLEKIEMAQNAVLKQNIVIDSEIRELEVHRRKIVELSQIKQVVKLIQQEVAVNRLISRNLASLNNLIARNLAKEKGVRKRLHEASKKEQFYRSVLDVGALTLEALGNKQQSFKSVLEQFMQQIETHENISLNVSLINILDQKDKELRLNVEQITNKIQIKEMQLRQKQTLNRNYSDLLQKVNIYINNLPEIDECPLCHNTMVQDEHITKSRLLSLIDSTIIQGSKDAALTIKEQRSLQADLEYTVNQIDEVVRNPIITYVNTMLDKFRQFGQIAKEEIEQCNENLEDLGIKVRDQNLELQQFEVDVKLLGIDSDFTEITLLEMKERIEKNKQAVRTLLPDSLRYLNLIELTQQQQSIEQTLTKYLSETESVQLIYQKQQDLRSGNEILNKLKQIDGWILQGDDLEILQKQYQHEQEVLQLQEQVRQITGYKKDFEQLKKNIAIQEEALIKAQLEKHPIITFIYELINPHPFYNKLEIVNKKGGLHFKNEGKEIHLDQIFSAAQSNILVLSIFLGLGMTNQYSTLGQLFLDDPIQSMDDVNILGFIDLLRAILDSQSEQNNLVISTHDSNFAKLLGIKMRHRPFVEYRINAYGEEGPIIEVNTH